MSLEKNDAPEDIKDYTKHIWIGIFVIFLVMIVVIALQGDRVPVNSEVTTKHILVSYTSGDPADRARALELIQEIRQRIVNGESFESMAEMYSDDPGTASKGGYLGPQPRGTFTDEYEEFAWTAPLNELSEIVETGFGFHLIVVTERFVSDTDRYEEELEERVMEERANERNSSTPAGTEESTPDAN